MTYFNIAILEIVRDENGGSLIEFTIIVTLLLTVTLGISDFSVACYQILNLEKSTQMGARLAATLDPPAAGLDKWDGLTDPVDGSDLGLIPGADAFPQFATIACTNTGCSNWAGGFDADAFNQIVFGVGSSSCTDALGPVSRGMCDVSDLVKPENLIVEYSYAEIGYAGQYPPPVMITIRLVNLPPFGFSPIGDLAGVAIEQFTTTSATIQAEDMSNAGLN